MDAYFFGSQKKKKSKNVLGTYTFAVFKVSLRMSSAKNFMLCNKLCGGTI